MISMTDTILQQVTKQVKKTMEAINFARPLPTFDYVPTVGCEPSYMHAPVGYYAEVMQQVVRPERNVRSRERNHNCSMWDRCPRGSIGDPGRCANPAMAFTPYTTQSRRMTWPRPGIWDSHFTTNPRSILIEVKGHLMLRKPQPMTTALKPHSARKYYEFHEQNDHTTVECSELEKALHELTDKGQIYHFLKKGPRFLHKERDLERVEPREEECSTEIVATITDGHAKGIIRMEGKVRGAQEVLTSEQGGHVTVPIMVFNGREGPHCTSSHTNPLMVELKVASALVHRILIGTGSFVDIITCDCVKRNRSPRRPQSKLLLRFGDKCKARNLEVDFLVIVIPTAYNVILGRPTLHKVKAVSASYLLQLQYEADDGSVGKLQGDNA
ncbi:LOW QUALITY PROTEIN: hypothetical protein Cgig2_030699 [Carnegiea gigantea]|uniref:Uncharacterized protein n=1 Tax=Carnegiea gigantea TaxID=171969 RepID=A0A9Q1GVK1_9CARY|nr:LOW QUALITY PROTEIN: hypothetical protein Cgig2_030699 [Carnegiea gigantea]